jgi:hypothetical protein
MILWKPCLARTLFAALAATAALGAHAQDATPAAVTWTLDVLRDGQSIDQFQGTTTVGQAHTDTHHHVVTNDVGCKDQPGGSIDLQRTVTVSPLMADASHAILAIDAQETLQSDQPQQTPEGCKLPPQPRRINASHPGLTVPAGQTVSWQLIDANPSLAYRISASVAQQQP